MDDNQEMRQKWFRFVWNQNVSVLYGRDIKYQHGMIARNARLRYSLDKSLSSHNNHIVI